MQIQIYEYVYGYDKNFDTFCFSTNISFYEKRTVHFQTIPSLSKNPHYFDTFWLIQMHIMAVHFYMLSIILLVQDYCICMK